MAFWCRIVYRRAVRTSVTALLLLMTGLPSVAQTGNAVTSPGIKLTEERALSSRTRAGCRIGHPDDALRTPSSEDPYETWRSLLEREAVRCGISQRTVSTAMRQARILQDVKTKDGRQSEFVLTFGQYLRNSISNQRISTGRKHLKTYSRLLDAVERRYGVSSDILVALWAMESNFGTFSGNYDVLSSLTTLAYRGRRSPRFSFELLNALYMLDLGVADQASMTGSWAGAMGQPQFMPSTFINHAIDGDGDGRADIWHSVPDVFHSAANYLANIGWQRGVPWGMEVRLPPGFDAFEARLSNRQSQTFWRKAGLQQRNGNPLPVSARKGAVVLPSGYDGPALLVFENFFRLLEWNRSLHYALAVGHLADRFSGAPPLTGLGAGNEARHDRQRLQQLQHNLNRLGFRAGKPDGMVGGRTRQAIRDYQRARGITADGYPAPALISRVEADAQTTTGPLTREERRRLQAGLNALGFDAGPVDGVVGPRTRRAVETYRARYGLAENAHSLHDILMSIDTNLNERNAPGPDR